MTTRTMMKRVLRWSLWSFATLTLLLALGVFALTREPGLRWALSDVLPRFVPGLRISGVRGDLAALRLDNLTYEDASVSARIGHVALNWQPNELWSRRLTIAHLNIEQVDIRTHPEPTPTNNRPVVLPDIALPLVIDCRDCVLRKLRLIQGETITAIDRIGLGVHAASSRVDLERLELTMPGAHARADGLVVLQDHYPLSLKLAWDSQLNGEAWSGQGRLAGDTTRLYLQHELRAPLHLNLSGELDRLLTDPAFDLVADWQHLAWPPKGDAKAELSRGFLAAKGTLETYAWQLKSGFTAPGAPPSTWLAHGSGTLHRLDIDQALVAIADGQLKLQGSVDWEKALKLELDASGEHLNPGVIAANWPGSLDFRLSAHGGLAAGDTLEFSLPELKGHLRQFPLTVAARGRYGDETLELDTLSGHYGSAELAGKLQYGKTLAAELKLNIPTLQGLVPEAAGRLKLHANASGSRDAPTIDLDAQGQSLRLAGNRVHDLELRARLDSGHDLDLAMTANQLALGGTAIASVRLDAEGSEASHRLNAEIRESSEQRLRLALDGSLTAHKRWQGRLRDGELVLKTLGRWQIGAANLAYENGGGSIDRLCLSQAPALLCVDAKAENPDNWKAKLALQQLPLALLTAPLPALHSDSELTLNADAASRDGQLSAKADGRLSAGSLRYIGKDDPEIVLEHQGGELHAALAGNALDANLDFKLDDHQGIHGVVRLEKPKPENAWTDGENRLAGALKTRFERLDLVSLFAPGLEQVKGRLDSDIHLAGSLGKPAVTGALKLEQGAAKIPAAGLDIQDLNLAAEGSPEGLQVDGKARSGDGELSLSGHLNPLAEGLPMRLSLKGDHFQVVNLKEAKAWLSPELAIALDGRDLNVSGTLAIPEARIEPKTLPASAVQPSEDVVFVDQRAEKPKAAGIVPHIDVRVILGDKVNLKGFGLVAQLGGDLQIRQSGNADPIGKGELKVVKGSYEAYGQQLTIAKGRLIFIGPVTNPLLDLEAVRKFDTPEKLTVGIRGRGNVRKPDLRLFADKAMEERDMLSYLLIGRPLGEAQGGQGQMLSNAALNMGLTGAAGLAQSVGDRLGLTNTTITTKGSGDDTAVVLGTWLSPKLYMDYGSAVLGNRQAGAQWSLSYFFNKRLKLEAVGGVNTGADLKYTVEKN